MAGNKNPWGNWAHVSLWGTEDSAGSPPALFPAPPNPLMALQCGEGNYPEDPPPTLSKEEHSHDLPVCILMP
jgi:hypothetical protein